ncbi:MAG: SDR family oxidoreductase [Deltaproteobacteria bacterium]|nr:SDR family oxidoreductase [Deltaproteobacteria bacterium]
MTQADATMKGKTCMITGATSGIGQATAVALARLGAKLILVCRHPKKGAATQQEIAHQTGNEDVQLILADLSSQAAVRQLAADFLATNQPLHVLINNAGVVNLQRQLTSDGIEEVFAVNHLAYFLLTNLLLDRLKASTPSRIVNVASEAHKVGPINFNDLGGAQRYRTMRAYGQSKLANIMFTYELARRLEGSGVTVNGVHPGAVATGLGKNNGRWAQGLIKALGLFFKTPEQGAATSIYVAASPQVEGVSGKYFLNSRERKTSKASYDVAAQQRLWKVSGEMTGLR